MITVFFVDEGQDFLEWDLDGEGKVVGCRPFQGDIWIGTTVLNKNIKPGDFLEIIDKEGGRHELIHAVEKVQQTMERLAIKYVDIISAFLRLLDESVKVLNEQNVAPFCQAIAGEMRKRGMSEDAISSTLKGIALGKENWASIEHGIQETPNILDVGRGDSTEDSSREE